VAAAFAIPVAGYWRRFGGPALWPWLVGLCLLVVPAAIAESYPHYLVSDIPPLCVAAALGIQQISTLKGKGLGLHQHEVTAGPSI
jgi:hypothetical protein